MPRKGFDCRRRRPFLDPSHGLFSKRKELNFESVIKITVILSGVKGTNLKAGTKDRAPPPCPSFAFLTIVYCPPSLMTNPAGAIPVSEGVPAMLAR